MRTSKVVVVCGSRRYVEMMAVTEWLIQRDEHAITIGLGLLPDWYPYPLNHLAEYEGCSSEMDKLYLEKINLADELFVVDYENYIGESTRNKIAYAETCNVPVRYFSKEPIGQQILQLVAKGNRCSVSKFYN